MITTKKHWRLLAIGLLIVNFDFFLSSFITIPDFWIGVMKGVGIGLMLMSVYCIARLKKIESEVKLKNSR